MGGAEIEKSDMTAQEFITWTQTRFHLPNRSAAVRKAAEVMRTGENTIWQWLSGKRKTSESMLLLMELIIRTHSD